MGGISQGSLWGAVGAALMWMAVSSGLVLLNSYILTKDGFPYPICLSSAGQLFSFLATFLLNKFGIVRVGSGGNVVMNRRFYMKHVMPIGLLAATTLSAGNWAYLHLSVSFIQMLKAGTPVVTLIVMVLFNLERLRKPLVVSVAVIALGCSLAAYGEIHFAINGFLCMVISELAEALKLVLSQLLLSGRVQFSPFESLYYIAPAAFGWMVVGMYITGETSKIVAARAWEQVFARPGIYLVAASLGFCVNLLVLAVIQRTSSLTFKITGQLKNVLVVVCGVVMFGNIVTGIQAVGYSVAIIGFFLYTRAQSLKNKTTYPAAPSPSHSNSTLQSVKSEELPLYSK